MEPAVPAPVERRLAAILAWAHEYFVAPLGYLGRLDESRVALERARAQFPEYFQRYRQRPRWRVPQDWEMLVEGLRRAAGETT
jgi:hypothetical protein